MNRDTMRRDQGRRLHRRRLWMTAAAGALLITTQTAPSAAQNAAQNATRPAAVRAPFGLGERMDYELSGKALGGLLGLLEAHGVASMDVSAVDTIRGQRAWHLIFKIHGSFHGWTMDDRYDSWLDLDSLASLRYFQDKHEGSYKANHHFEMFPSQRKYSEDGDTARPSVPHPLDDGSFLFFVRAMPLAVGLDTSFNDYFIPDRNPVRIRVIRRDTIKVAGATCAAVVVAPIINTPGMFSQGGDMQVWFSDDVERIVLQIKANIPKIPIGRLTLALKSYRLAGADSTRRTPACR